MDSHSLSSDNDSGTYLWVSPSAVTNQYKCATDVQNVQVAYLRVRTCPAVRRNKKF